MGCLILLRKAFKSNKPIFKEAEKLPGSKKFQVKLGLHLKIRTHSFWVSSVFLFLLLSFAFDGEAYAKTIYVAKNGNDRNAGTLSQPLATPAKALDIANPGDTIYLREGRYVIEHFLWIDKANLTIASNPNEKAAIVGGIEENDKNPTSVIITAASNISILNLEIEGGSYYGIKVDIDKEPASRGVTIRNCYIHGSGRDCIKTFNADNLLIENCEIGPSGLRDPSNAEGIDSIGSIGVTIRNCYVHDAATTGIYLKGGARNGVIERNRVEHSRGAGILLGQDTDLEYMRDKTIYECLDSVARNNIIADTQYAGIGTYSGSNVRFENNTIYEAAKQGQAGFYVVWNKREVPAQKVSFKNNIVVVNSHRPQVFLFNLSDQLVSEANLYFGNRLFRRESKALGRVDDWTFPQWKQGMKVDVRSLFADPLLDEDNLFKPRTGSPAFDRGEALVEVKTDYAGVNRPQGTGYDIGAHEGKGSGATISLNDNESTNIEGDTGLHRKQIFAVIIGVLSGSALFALALLVQAKLFQAQTMQSPDKYLSESFTSELEKS
jgi:hypothetical protein